MLLRIAFSILFSGIAVAGGGAPIDARSDRAVTSPSDQTVGRDRSLPPPAQVWTAQQVRDWAAAESPIANLLDAEGRAVGCSFDRNDAAQCAQARLLQSVLFPLALHQRNVSAAEALRVYYRIVGIEQQQDIVTPAITIVDELIDLAERADALGLPDGDSNALHQQRLELQSQAVEADFGVKQLRVQLAELTGRPRLEAFKAELISPLEVPHSLQEPDEAVRDALANRQDLRAIENLCCQINSNTLPAVRQIFAGLQPGLGMAAAATGGKRTLLSHHESKPNNGDLDSRRRQCQLLQQARRSQIESEVFAAALNLAGLTQRVELARQRAVLAETTYEESVQAVELDQMPIGADKQRQLQWLEIRGEHVQGMIDAVLADVQLREARGMAAAE